MSQVTPPTLNLNALNFDTCERLRHLESLLQQMNVMDGAAILDVGGYPCYMARAFPHYNIVTADVFPNGHAPYVKASGAALPFADNTFEISVACDVLEHVPPPYRESFLTELARVSQCAVIVAGPYTTPGAQRAENVVRSLLPPSSPAQAWLAEHRECGLPTLAETMAVFAGQSVGTKVLPVGTLTSWLLFFAGQAAAERNHDQAQVFQSYIEKYNALAAALDTTSNGPAYRHAVIATFTQECWTSLLNTGGDVSDHAHEGKMVEDYVDSLGNMLSGFFDISSKSNDSAGTIDAEYVARLEQMIAHGGSSIPPAPASIAKLPLSSRIRQAIRLLAGK